MYPDTDTPPLPIPDTMVAEVRSQLGEAPWLRANRYRKMGLDARAAGVLSTAPWGDLFDQVAPKAGEPARRLAAVLEKRIPYHARRARGSKPRRTGEVPDASRVAPLVRALERGELRPDALVWAVDEVLETPARSPEAVLERFRHRPDDREALDRFLAEIVQESRTMSGRSGDTIVRWALGRVLRKFFGRIDPSSVRDRLWSLLIPRPGGEEAGS
jgi:Glu-tRNA(Gln) amidotransferase subunit E-like FAD-binding protein